MQQLDGVYPLVCQLHYLHLQLFDILQQYLECKDFKGPIHFLMKAQEKCSLNNLISISYKAVV